MVRRQMVKVVPLPMSKVSSSCEVFVAHGQEHVVQLVGHLVLRVIYMSQRERIGGENVFCLKELHGEVVGARHREAKGQLVVDGGLRAAGSS